MTTIDKPMIYFRKNRPDNAVIYVRGETEDVQELKCRAYAKEMGYEVSYVTRNLENVKHCDVLLVANFSRISRKQIEFVKTYKLLKARGIRVEDVNGNNNIGGMFSTRDIYKCFETYEFKKKNDK